MSGVPSPFRGRIGDPLDTYALDVWDPLKDFSFFFPDSSPSSGQASSIVNAGVDWKQTPEAHVKKEEIKVEDEDEDEGNVVLQFSSGERSVEEKKENETWHREEPRGGGKLMSWFRMPENAKMDRIKAAMECGVLTMTVPKTEVKKPDVKAIQISG
ncbi:17.3 kDa class I heat shock protein-like [Humulus lupulus]|uniref:17.3 kDa class I heat shock protein-like n=1 Tax=Humulus lupulus TaxID=3486 RepID=UPI002B40C3F7|nr:17.3 kDa class I heat shock protein-like [Humulus lupulus]